MRPYWGPFNNSAQAWGLLGPQTLKKHTEAANTPPSGQQRPVQCIAFSLCSNLLLFLVFLSSSSHLSSLFFPHQFPFPILSLANPPAPPGHLPNRVKTPAQRSTKKAGRPLTIPLTHPPDHLLCPTQASWDGCHPPTPGHPAGLPLLLHCQQPPAT